MNNEEAEREEQKKKNRLETSQNMEEDVDQEVHWGEVHWVDSEVEVEVVVVVVVEVEVN